MPADLELAVGAAATASVLASTGRHRARKTSCGHMCTQLDGRLDSRRVAVKTDVAVIESAG